MKVQCSIYESALKSLVESPIKVLNGNQDWPVLEGRTCVMEKWVTGLLPLNCTSVNSPLDTTTLTPYEWAVLHWTRYKDADDSYSFPDVWTLPPLDPPPTYAAFTYTGERRLSGAGDCPTMSGYPEISDLVAGPAYHYAPDGGYWSDYFGDPPANWSFGIGLETATPTSISATTRSYSDPWTAALQTSGSETLDMAVSNPQDNAAKYDSAADEFLAETFSTDWTVDPWYMQWNDWLQFIVPDGSDSYLLDPDDYDGTVITGANVNSSTPTSMLEMISGWDISYSFPYGNKIAAQRYQLRYTGVGPLVLNIGRIQRGALYGRGWDGDTDTRQWVQRVQITGCVVLNPVGGYAVYEIPFTSGLPFPIQNLFDMPVLSDYTFVYNPAVTHIQEGDLFKQWNGSAWVDDYEPIPA